MSESGHGNRQNPPREQREGRKRSEEKFEQWGLRVGQRLGAATTRAREEAERIWAEAQSIRRGQRR
jgi:hypothetical protein